MGCNRFRGFSRQQMHRQNRFDQPRLNISLGLRCRLQVFVGLQLTIRDYWRHANLSVTKVEADNRCTLSFLKLADAADPSGGYGCDPCV